MCVYMSVFVPVFYRVKALLKSIGLSTFSSEIHDAGGWIFYYCFT